MPETATRERAAGRGRGWLPAAVLPLAPVLLALAVYGGSVTNEFTWDDEQIIVTNPVTRDISRIGDVLTSPDEVRPYYRPLNRASYLVDYQLFGMRPGPFHVVNVTLHGACVLALFALTLRISGRAAAAFAAAALLAVHPVNSEAVNFITARNNLFALLFSILAVWLFLRAHESGSSAWASASALLLGLAGKEQAAMALPVIVVLAVVPGGLHERRLRAGMIVPYIVAIGVYLAARRLALGSLVASSGAAAAGLWSRLVADLEIIPRYVGLIVFPKTLTTFHAVPASYPAWWLVAAWVGLATAVVMLLRTRDRTIGFGLLWFGLNLLPIANIVPLPSAAMAERYLYVPAAGAWIALGALWDRLFRVPGWRRAAIAGGAVLLAVLGVRTAVRTADWRDDLTLFRSAAAADPGSTPARLSLAVALKDRGDLAGARREWDELLRRDPRNADALTQLGTAAAVEGDLATAERLYRRALGTDARQPLALFNMGKLCERTGRPAEAVEFYRRFLAEPNDLYREYRPIAEDRLRALSARPGTATR